MKDNTSLNKKQEEKIHCFNCKYTRLDMDREPCASCDIDFSNWKSRQEGQSK